MFCGKQILKMKNDEIYALKRKVDDLTVDLKWARSELESTRKAYAADARSAPVIIDWDNVDVFSVERMHTRNNLECMPYTVIGYWKNVNENGIMVKKTGEWIYQVNDVGHHKIAEEFKEYIAKKVKKK